MKIYNVRVRRDASTQTPVEVPEHEISILQEIYGTENVHNLDGKRIDEVGLTDADVAADVERDPTTEFERLAARYGGNDEGLIVEQVFGKRASRGLDVRLKEIAEKEAKAKAKAKLASENAKGQTGKNGANGAPGQAPAGDAGSETGGGK